jgi:hypothetical protein
MNNAQQALFWETYITLEECFAPETDLRNFNKSSILIYMWNKYLHE